MLSLLKTEWLKIKTYRTFWAILILYAILFPLANVLIANINLQIKHANKNIETIITNYYAFPDVWRAVCYVGGYFLLLPSILIIILVTNEYAFRTHRQNVIDGWSRSEFISGKLLMVVLLAVVSTVITIIAAFILGFKYSGPGEKDLFTNFYLVGNFFIQALSYLLLAFITAIIFKRSGVTIGLFLLFITVIDSIIVSLMNKYLGNSGYFFLTAPADNLVPNPFIDLAKGSGIFDVPFSASTFLVVSLMYIPLFISFLYWRFKRVDL